MRYEDDDADTLVKEIRLVIKETDKLTDQIEKILCGFDNGRAQMCFLSVHLNNIIAITKAMKKRFSENGWEEEVGLSNELMDVTYKEMFKLRNAGTTSKTSSMLQKQK